MNDKIFEEFDFPKLRHLYCFSPKKLGLAVLARMLAKMPCLDEMNFSQTGCTFAGPCLKVRVEFLSYTGHYTRSPPEAVHEMYKAFELCPTSKLFRSDLGTLFYAPFTKKFSLKKKKTIIFNFWNLSVRGDVK